ncbi:MAG: acyl--CoA ligase, partial [Bdellovibrionales bacterium]|nr:acyl--CoA ligase [Bdellovibrionales bacterium]
WLYTGDVVRLSGEGEEMKLVFLGRQTDVIRNGKTFLTADPIDAAVKSIPGVEDAAGFFKQNMAGEEQVAVAVVKTGKGLGEKEIMDGCAPSLRSELQPRFVYFVESIPKDAGGNVNRFSLRRQFTGMD